MYGKETERGKALSFESLSTSKKIPSKGPARKRRKSENWKKVSSSSENDEEPQYVSTDDSDSSYGEDNDAQCAICKGLYSNDCHGRNMVKMCNFNQWSHAKCDKRKANKEPNYASTSATMQVDKTSHSTDASENPYNTKEMTSQQLNSDSESVLMDDIPCNKTSNETDSATTENAVDYDSNETSSYCCSTNHTFLINLQK
ncbi:hypothetical protein AVEN_84999-1 [Araneus ventricosus]|uniref:Uncharacterized protein n=1 Tax=Araneus ventricosus TaxID=182803 RepID=A0A4Y2BZJ4_ARAVE|nr:hypothetical protein AVEN_84999-1 [Araneus ventricosus]